MGKFVITPKNGNYAFNLKAGNHEVIGVSQTYKALVTCKNGVQSVRVNAPAAVLENQTVEGFKVEKHPKFEVYQDKKGEFRFRLKAKNGQIILTGEGYTKLASCLNGIESIRKNAVDSDLVVEEEK